MASDAGDPTTCGVCAIDLTTGQVVALLRVETDVPNVFAVTVLPGRRYPVLINDDELLENSFTAPASDAGRKRECEARGACEGVRKVVHHSTYCITRRASEA